MPRLCWTDALALVWAAIFGWMLSAAIGEPRMWPFLVPLGLLPFQYVRQRFVHRRMLRETGRTHGRAAALVLEATPGFVGGRPRARVLAELEQLAGAEAVAQLLRERAAAEARRPFLHRPLRGLRAVALGAAVFAVVVTLVVLFRS